MQEINGLTKTCGLIGNPVEHTLSPVIHNTLARMFNHNLVYVPFLVEKGRVEDAVKGAFALNIHGLNVTVPYKSEVIASLCDVDELAGHIGAVNTLVRQENGYKGYNTDVTGLFRAMESENIVIEGEEIMILGAGGAARAVAYLCASRGARQIYLLNRTKQKSMDVANEINNTFHKDIIIPMELSGYKSLPAKKYLAIQATTVGLYPNVEDAIITEPGFYNRIHTGFDLIYSPLNTEFMQHVKEHGGKAYHGLKMLLYQGVNAYELWNNVSVSKAQAMEIYGLMKKAMGIHE